MTTNLYDFFDDIVCINLETVPERREYAQGVFDRLGIPARFFTAKKHPKGGRYGCFDSHIQVVQQAYSSGATHLLVFEDDLLPTSSYSNETMMEAVRFMQTDTNWDILYLGSLCVKKNILTDNILFAPTVPSFPNVIQFNPFSSHALCYHRRCMEKLLASYKAYIGTVHYDVWMANYLNLQNYCFVPMLFEQSFSESSCVESHTLIETIGRFLLPYIQYIHMDYRVSLLKHFLNRNPYLFYLCVLVTIIVIASIWSRKKNLP